MILALHCARSSPALLQQPMRSARAEGSGNLTPSGSSTGAQVPHQSWWRASTDIQAAASLSPGTELPHLAQRVATTKGKKRRRTFYCTFNSYVCIFWSRIFMAFIIFDIYTMKKRRVYKLICMIYNKNNNI